VKDKQSETLEHSQHG